MDEFGGKLAKSLIEEVASLITPGVTRTALRERCPTILRLDAVTDQAASSRTDDLAVAAQRLVADVIARVDSARGDEAASVLFGVARGTAGSTKTERVRKVSSLVFKSIEHTRKSVAVDIAHAVADELYAVDAEHRQAEHSIRAEAARTRRSAQPETPHRAKPWFVREAEQRLGYRWLDYKRKLSGPHEDGIWRDEVEMTVVVTRPGLRHIELEYVRGVYDEPEPSGMYYIGLHFTQIVRRGSYRLHPHQVTDHPGPRQSPWSVHVCEMQHPMDIDDQVWVWLARDRRGFHPEMPYFVSAAVAPSFADVDFLEFTVAPTDPEQTWAWAAEVHPLGLGIQRRTEHNLELSADGTLTTRFERPVAGSVYGIDVAKWSMSRTEVAAIGPTPGAVAESHREQVLDRAYRSLRNHVEAARLKQGALASYPNTPAALFDATTF